MKTILCIIGLAISSVVFAQHGHHHYFPFRVANSWDNYSYTGSGYNGYNNPVRYNNWNYTSDYGYNSYNTIVIQSVPAPRLVQRYVWVDVPFYKYDRYNRQVFDAAGNPVYIMGKQQQLQWVYE